jgi:hypothetical protein
MNPPRTGAAAGILVLLALLLTACAGSSTSPSSSPTPTGTSSGPTPSGTASEGGAGGGNNSGGSSSGGSTNGGGDDTDAQPGSDSGFVIDCVGLDGSTAAFATLNDAWSSPNYVRITGCTATADPGVTLNSDQEHIAAIADDGGDPMTTYLQVLAACVRITPDEIPAQPTELLQAVQALCPQAPEAGLVASALQAQGAG